MNTGLRWDDLRIALAVATAGSLSGAGRSLGLSHATVFRRLRDIEDRLGVRLFERSRTGYAPTTAGEDSTVSPVLTCHLSAGIPLNAVPRAPVCC